MKTTRRSGSAILVVLGIISVVSIVCGMLGFAASQQMRASQITRDLLAARLVAESGLNMAYRSIRNDFSQINGEYTRQGTFGGGRYTVTATPLGDGEVTRAKLVSQGVCGLGRFTVSADLENRPLAAVEDIGGGRFFPLAFDLLVGSTLSLKGNFKAQVTAVHANGAVTLTGSSKVDATTISSARTVAWKSPPAGVTLLPNQAAVEILPSALTAAINDLKAYAIEHGAVYSSGAQIPASPPGGVAYCTGSDSGWSGVGTGCFIFEGTFSSKHLTINNVNNYPAVIVLSPSSVQFNAGTVINGALIMPSSSLKLNGHAEIYGPILIGQTLTGNGTADLYAGGGQGFNLPPVETVTDNVVITAWH